MLSKQELLYTLALQRAPNLGDISAKKLIRTIGSPSAVFKEKKNILSKIDGIGHTRLKDLNEKLLLPQAEEELKFIEHHHIKFRYYLDDHYPEKLKHCIDGPILFFEKGNIDLKGKRLISIVGTRKITAYGQRFCKKLVETLAPLNPVIVSGFAYGVDILAQRTAMDCGLQTIGCMAHGFDQVYPRNHKKYVHQVEAHGGFITEFWSTDTFDRNNFLKRNRIIAGLTEATIVIESAEKGGSLVTADIANSYNREVFAVPGRTTDSQSEGCNRLIQQQRAHLLTSAEDLIYMLGWDLEEKQHKPLQKKLFVALTPEEEQLAQVLQEFDKMSLDNLALQCNLPTFKVATLLLQMELKGVVQPLPGKLFQWV